MPEDLQSLLDKINSEGVKKAEEEKAKIIAAAKAEAEAAKMQSPPNILCICFLIDAKNLNSARKISQIFLFFQKLDETRLRI